MYSPPETFTHRRSGMPKFLVGRRQFALGAVTVAATALIKPGQAMAHAEALTQSNPAGPVATLGQPTAVDQPAVLDQQTQAAMARLSPQAQAEVEMKVTEI